ncbi:GtrA family protein [Paludibacter propionicigenes WB4]|uniref:GtrA family protein n=1 Tax=Paludibacter propionicigenes (strain DSM 17365 / JCM 13257 / WB4) TaxID=694427 RepID=E4T757_PALPW|nr:GtrA family protein [Paludibacter propionicigenes]ADQ80551.1 GtrA family protein [Paludibacter propionicigenes WB4]
MVEAFNYLAKFFKAQVASLTATLVDFSITYILTSFVGFSYILSSGIGVVCGGVVNFTLGRYWVFSAENEKKADQIPRYMLVWLSSMLLNMGGIIFFTEIVGLYYLISKIATAVIVGVFFNYYLQKTFVFKTKTKSSI